MNTTPYQTDTTDAQWKILQDYVDPKPSKRGPGAPRTVNIRRVVDAIFYINRTGCQYRMLPHDFPKWQLVYYYFRKWTKNGIWQSLHDALRERVREEERPQERPTASVDSQSTDSHGTQEARGFDGGKKLDGRKRHIIVDSLGLILAVVITAGNVSDAEGGAACLDQMDPEEYPKIQKIYADGTYNRPGFYEAVEDWQPGCKLEVVSRPEGSQGYVRLPIRWTVERTFGWITKNRRLCRSYEHTVESEVAHVTIAMIKVMLNRVSPTSTKDPKFSYRK